MNYRAYASSVVLTLALAAPAAPTATAEQAQPGQQGMQGQTSQPHGMQGQSGQPQVMRVDQITGKKVVNRAGKEVGEIDGIVRDRQTNALHAVVSVGGFLGIGDKDVTIPLKDLQMHGEGDRLVAPDIASTEEQLKSRPAYAEGQEQYQEVADEQRIDLASGSLVGGASFAQLDKDGDGFVSRDEARKHDGLSSNWSQYDSNRDDRLDQSEFAAFEIIGEQGMQPGQPGQGTRPQGGARD